MNKHKHIWTLIDGNGPKNYGDSYIQKCKVCNLTRKHVKNYPEQEAERN
jgi:hypothetical protein